MAEPSDAGFYERFWRDADYQLAYAFDSAVRDRYPAIRRVWGDLLSPSRVLDYGCGNGVLSYWMHCNGFGRDVIGLDVSRTGILSANRFFGRDGLEFRVLEADRTIPNLGHFDAVVASHVLEHIEAPGEVLARLGPIAEWFILEVPLEDCLVQSVLAKLRRRDRLDNPVGHVQFWNRKSFRRFVESCGFIIVRDHLYTSSPYSLYTHPIKRLVERGALAILGTKFYSFFMASHYTVLARRLGA